jgi:hypothetical protein
LLLAKVLLTDPSVVIIDEPTRGIDIANKAQIYAFIQGLVAKEACIVISSEMQELIGVCDRILVMREGRVTGEVSGAAMTESNVALLAPPAPRNRDRCRGRRHDRHHRIVADGANANSTSAGPMWGLPRWRRCWWSASSSIRTSSPPPTSPRRHPQRLPPSSRSARAFVISSGGLDLSVGSMAAFITGITIVHECAGAACGCLGHPPDCRGDPGRLLCGLANGLIVTMSRIEPFIATLGTMGFSGR